MVGKEIPAPTPTTAETEMETQNTAEIMSDDLSVLSDDDQKFVEDLFKNNIAQINLMSWILVDDLQNMQGTGYQENLSEYSSWEEAIIQSIMSKININKYIIKNDKEWARTEYHKQLKKEIFSKKTLSVIITNSINYPNLYKQISISVAEDVSEYIDNSLQSSLKSTTQAMMTENILTLNSLSIEEQNNVIKALRVSSEESQDKPKEEWTRKETGEGSTTNEASMNETSETTWGSKIENNSNGSISNDKSDNWSNGESNNDSKEKDKSNEYVPDHTIDETKIYIIDALRGKKGKDISNLIPLTKVKFTSDEWKGFKWRISSVLCIDKYNSILSEPAYQEEKAGRSMVVTSSTWMKGFLSSVKDYLSYYSKIEQNTDAATTLSAQTDIMYTKLQGIFTRERNDLMFDVNTTNTESQSSWENAIKALKYIKKIEKNTWNTSTLWEVELTEFLGKIDTKSIVTVDQVKNLTAQLSIAKKLTIYLSDTKKEELNTKINDIISDIYLSSQTMSLKDQVTCYTSIDKLFEENETGNADKEDDEDESGDASIVQLEKTLTPIFEWDYSSDPELKTFVATIQATFNKLKKKQITLKEFQTSTESLIKTNEAVFERLQTIMETKNKEKNDKKEKEKEKKQSPIMKSWKASIIGSVTAGNDLSLLEKIDPKNPLLPQKLEESWALGWWNTNLWWLNETWDNSLLSWTTTIQKDATKTINTSEEEIYYQDNETPTKVNIETIKMTYRPYPNPVAKDGKLNINLGVNKQSDWSALFDSYIIYGVDGREVKKMEGNGVPYDKDSNKLSIDIQQDLNVANWIYFIQLYNSANSNINLNAVKKDENTSIGAQKIVIV